MQPPLPPDLLRSFSQFVEDRIGLHLPEGRLADIERGLRAAATEMGWTDAEKFGHHLMEAPNCQELVDLLAAHLTIGETYFYRDPRAFEVLEKDVLPEILRRRSGGEKTLRIWSAACCTGEEPYSIAMAVHRVLGERTDWKVNILATDLNPRFLRKAAAGIYGPWSFRTLPESMRQTYFHQRSHDRWELSDRIKNSVTFAGLNFIEDEFPSPMNSTQRLDIIFCRNVLMYFSRESAGTIIGKMRRCLVEGGYLFTSATDAPRDLFQGLKPHEVEGTVIYRRCDEAPAVQRPLTAVAPLVLARLEIPPVPQIPLENVPGTQAEASKPDTITGLAQLKATSRTLPDFRQEARRLADQGRLDEAMEAVNLAIKAEKLDAVAHYLRGVILHEQQLDTEAVTSLQRALYLDPAFVIAHVTLGNLMRRLGKEHAARRSFENARSLLMRIDRDEVLPEAGGITAGRLLNMISTPKEAAA